MANELRTPDLFDEPEDASEQKDAWQEVPQALFLSWSRAMQLAYCARRDDHAASQEDNYDIALWFTERAEMYRELIRCSTK